MRNGTKWDIRFIELAEMVGSWSKDPSTKVGAVIVDESNRIVSLGFNGFPRGVSDNSDLYQNRDEKYKRVLHAEQNAILFASPKELQGCTLYVHPFQPCHKCALEIIQVGIRRIVTLKDTTDRWGDSFKLSTELFEEAGVELEIIDE